MMIEVIVGFWKNKIAYVYHIGYIIFMNYISDPDGYEGIAFQKNG
jgi:hypothetical protein